MSTPKSYFPYQKHFQKRHVKNVQTIELLSTQTSKHQYFADIAKIIKINITY